MKKEFKILIDGRHIVQNMDGISRYLLNLIKHISEIAESKNIVFQIPVLNDEWNIFDEIRKKNNIELVRLPIQPFSAEHYFIGSKLNKEINLYHYGQFNLPINIKVPSVITIHDLNPQFYKGFFVGRIANIKRSFAVFSNYLSLLKSERVIAISKNTEKEILVHYGSKFKSKIRVVYEGLWDNDTQKKENIDEFLLLKLKKKYSFDKFLLYVGNNRPHKNLERLITALKLLHKSGLSTYKIVFVGHQNPLFKTVANLAEKYNMGDDVINFSASDEELLTLYKAAEGFVYCSLSEGFGLPLLEAMSLGTPVITSGMGATKEVANDAAILVDPFSARSIADGMKCLIEKPELKRDLVLRGYRNAENFSWKKCAGETLDVYKEILNFY